jgi:predicted GNAT family N-acyltransferase
MTGFTRIKFEMSPPGSTFDPMNIRPYKFSDRASCLSIFHSNLPRYLDESELAGFELWLNGLDQGVAAYGSSEEDHYFVLENDESILACGGFYIAKHQKSVTMAWGMVDHAYHKKGFGKELFLFRLQEIKKNFPGYSILLDTSQHTYPFFERFGFTVLKVTENGYGPGLHRYDMESAI